MKNDVFDNRSYLSLIIIQHVFDIKMLEHVTSTVRIVSATSVKSVFSLIKIGKKILTLLNVIVKHEEFYFNFSIAICGANRS